MTFKLADLKMRPKLIFLFVLTGILPLLIAGYYGSQLAATAMMEKSFGQLDAVQTIRTGQLESVFKQRSTELQMLAKSDQIREFSQKLIEYQNLRTQSHIFETKNYKVLESAYAETLKRFVASYGCQDIKIVEANKGLILFSNENFQNMGHDLNQTTYAGSGLARAWKTILATGEGVIIDFEPYAPANGVETAFFGQPVKDASGQLLAAVIVQVTPNFIRDIMESRKGMGETGESYLLGWDANQDRFELRSDLQTMGDGKFVIGFSLEKTLEYWKDAVKKGAAGGRGAYVDSAGKKVLVSYNKLDITGMNWFLISEIDQYEVEAPVRNILLKTLFLSILLVTLIGAGAFFLSRTITRPIIEDVKFAQAIANGEFDKTLKLNQRDELGKLAWALNHMARTLREQDWLKTGKEGLDNALRGELSEQQLGRKFVTFMAKHLGAHLGALYRNDAGVLKLYASYAFSDRKGNFNTIKLGEGMVGQAALEQEIIIFNDVGEEGPMIHYGAGQKPAASYIIVPIPFEKELIGVLLLGSLTQFTDLEKQFIDQNIKNTAILMNTAKSRRTIKHLLEEAQQHQQELLAKNQTLEKQTQALKESEAELKSQQEELRVTNEELEEQARALKESETELQAQQEELRVTNEELEEQTRNLEEQKKAIEKKNVALVDAQEDIQTKAAELEIASKYKSEFLANMSHELRTPLNSILILSQLLGTNKNQNLTEKQIESAKAIHSSGEDLLTLINEILDLSKVEAGKIELIPEDLGVQRLMDDVTRMFTDLAREKGIGFDIITEKDMVDTIYTDPLRLQQILRNLLTNAFKFTKQGQVSLTIARPLPSLLTGTALTPETSIALAVKDEGIGIPKEQQAVIFEAFQQADGSTSRKYGGTGLGLSISRELAKLLGGFIHLESKEAKGSTFTLVIPERHSPSAEPAPPPPKKALAGIAENKESLPPDKQAVNGPVAKPAPMIQNASVRDDRKLVSTGDKSLLIIEDDPVSAKIMRDFARERGFKCIIADDGESGLHFADYYKPSAIMLDIGLPGIDGWTVLERLKKNPQLRHIPVHFMSAADSSLSAMRMGALGFLTKPVTLEKVEETFSKIENILTHPVRKLLVVEDDSLQRKSIKELIGNGDVETTMVSTGVQAYEALTSHRYDCMILDLGLEDMSGFELLEKIRRHKTCSKIPVIVYTGRDLTLDEDKKLRKYTESIIIKGVKSPERLLEESALFLHRVEANLPVEKQKILKMVHDKGAVLSEKTILLVDDDMRNVFALSSVLEEKNMTVLIARDGIEGVKKAKEHKEIDLVLMDIMMPKMDGYEAIKEIRKTQKKLPIIALTAKAMKGDRNKCIEAGANDYLAKPVDPDKLISMLRVWLYA
ncbi:MAG: response regulator [Proteobacteria bacterium]|nr:response regulator [Desulfobacula sp.]MBU4130926.1 response regulator [Pseudomonadota bacterium]